MKIFSLFLVIFVCAATAVLPTVRGQQTLSKQRVSGGLASKALAANKLARLAPATPLAPMSVVLTPREPEKLRAFLDDLQNPASPNFQHWLTPEEFGERFGRTPDEYARLADWLTKAGFRVQSWPNRLQLTIDGDAATVERAFDVELSEYRLAGETAYASDRAPAVPGDLAPAIRGIAGMHGFTRFTPMTVAAPLQSTGGMKPSDLATAYNLGSLYDRGIDGRGVEVAVVARSDFSLDDTNAYRQQFNLPPKEPIKSFPFGPQRRFGNVFESEVVLNVELSNAVAPAADVRVVICPDIDFSLQSTVNNFPSARAINVSYGLCEGVAEQVDADYFAMLYAQAAAQGQSVFVASGNDGVSDCVRFNSSTDPSVNLLASSPDVTAVGGTELDPKFDSNGNATGYGGERAWSSSGGGNSRFYRKPAFQTGLAGDTPNRTVPDVAFLAWIPGHAITVFGRTSATFGTSTAAPCWTGFCALLNQARQARGLGNLNPEIYRLARLQTDGTAQGFNDVTQGSNTRGGVTGFSAGPGYDRVTGWGSYDAATLLNNFTFTPSSDTTAPTISLTAPNGGETLTFGGTFQIRWTSSDAVGIARHDILLSLDGGNAYNETIVTGLPGTAQSFAWTVGSTINTTPNPTTQARIAVRATDAAFNTTTAASQANFSLANDTTPPTVRVIFPNGGEKVRGGSTVTLTWESTDNGPLARHDVALSTDGGATYPTTLATGLPGTARSFQYAIPAGTAKTKTARIRVTATDAAGNQGRGASANDFVIRRPPVGN